MNAGKWLDIKLLKQDFIGRKIWLQFSHWELSICMLATCITCIYRIYISQLRYDSQELMFSYHDLFEKGLWHSRACFPSGFREERIMIIQGLISIRISLRKDNDIPGLKFTIRISLRKYYDIPEIVSCDNFYKKGLWYSRPYVSYLNFFKIWLWYSKA